MKLHHFALFLGKLMPPRTHSIKAVFTLKCAHCNVKASRFNDFESYKEAYE